MSLFDALRDALSIEEVARRCSRIDGNKARCVSGRHADNDLSIDLYGDHVHCFSCGFHGDVTDVWAAAHGFERPFEAALDLAREFGLGVPEHSPEEERKARERRAAEYRYLERAKAAHRVLDKHSEVREWWRRRGFDEGLIERFLLGANEDGTAATIPFWRRGRVQGLIERNLEGEPKYKLPPKEKLPDGHTPLFVPDGVDRSTFLVEGFTDALAISAFGESVVAVGGTNISAEQMRELGRFPGLLYILSDDDDEGAEA
jgi:DNA primase